MMELRMSLVYRKLLTPALLTLWWSSAASAAQEDLNSGLVFLKEQDILLTGTNWQIVLEVDISLYKKVVDQAMDMVAGLDKIVINNSTKDLKDFANDLHNVVTKESQNLLLQGARTTNQLETLMQTLTPAHKATKRSLIDVGGRILHFLFGTLDSRDLERINSKISTIQNKGSEVVHLLKDQLTYIQEATRRVNDNSIDLAKLETVTKLINKKIQDITNQIFTKEKGLEIALNSFFAISSAFRTLETTLTEIQDEVGQLREAISITSLGKLSSYFLSPTRLLSILTAMQPHLPSDLRLLTNLRLDEMYMYYSIAKVHAVAIGTKLRLIVDIPIKAENRYFNLYHALPLPVVIDNTTAAIYISPPKPYFAITEDQLTFIELTTADLSTCTRGIIHVCPPLTALRRRSFPSCLSALFLGDYNNAQSLCEKTVVTSYQPVFYRTQQGDTWVYSVKSDEILIQCPTTDMHLQLKSIKRLLTGAGTLNIPSNCYAHTADYTLIPHSSTAIQAGTLSLNLHIPPVFNILHHQTEAGHITALGTPDQVQEILDTFNSSPSPPLKIPYAEWKQKLESINTPWYSPKTSFFPHISFGMIVFFIFICLVLYWKLPKLRKGSRIIPLQILKNSSCAEILQPPTQVQPLLNDLPPSAPAIELKTYPVLPPDLS